MTWRYSSCDRDRVEIEWPEGQYLRASFYPSSFGIRIAAGKVSGLSGFRVDHEGVVADVPPSKFILNGEDQLKPLKPFKRRRRKNGH